MKSEATLAEARWLPLAVLAAAIGGFTLLAMARAFPESAFPSPGAVARGYLEEARSGRLAADLVASLWRVAVGYLLAVAASTAAGLALGHGARLRAAFMPAINFFRNLSPLAWIPFSILWFGIGDVPAMFLIFLAAFFPLTLAIIAAVAGIPSIYFQVARDYGIRGLHLVTRVTLPAIMPQFITSLRVTAGVAWMVIVAAEMIGVKEGLGYAVWDARNGLRTDLLVCAMINIGVIGVLIDRLLTLLMGLPGVRWGYER